MSTSDLLLMGIQDCAGKYAESNYYIRTDCKGFSVWYLHRRKLAGANKQGERQRSVEK